MFTGIMGFVTGLFVAWLVWCVKEYSEDVEREKSCQRSHVSDLQLSVYKLMDRVDELTKASHKGKKGRKK
jgi:hypothetical protein